MRWGRERLEWTCLIVGAGFAGATCARALADAGFRRARHRQAACTSPATRTTASTTARRADPSSTARISSTRTARSVFEHLSRFTAWRPYEHRVLAVPDACNGRHVSRSRSTARPSTTLYGPRSRRGRRRRVPRARRANRARRCKHVRGRGARTRSAATCARSSSAATRASSGDWTCRELSAGVAARIPTRTNDDDRYFTDRHQAMPVCTATRRCSNGMLDHPRTSSVRTGAWTTSRSPAAGIDRAHDDLHGPHRRLLRPPFRPAALSLDPLRA